VKNVTISGYPNLSAGCKRISSYRYWSLFETTTGAAVYHARQPGTLKQMLLAAETFLKDKGPQAFLAEVERYRTAKP
jgi:hypothetical protein